MQTYELEPKITPDEIIAATHDNDEHIGKSKYFKDLLMFLFRLQAFGTNMSASRVAYSIYEDDDQGWKEERLAKLRAGTASFTIREAEYFYEAFKRALGEEWARGIPLDDLILKPLKANLDVIKSHHVFMEWPKVDPVQTLHILEATQANPKIEISVLTIDDLHLSDQGTGLTENLESLDTRPTIKAGTEYYLQIKDKEPSRQHLVFEYANQPLQLAETLIQGQWLMHQGEDEDLVIVSGKDGEPLEILNHAGEFGFCVVSYPEAWDMAEAFGLTSELLSVTDMQKLVKQIRKLSLEKNSLAISLYDYVVPPL